MKNKVTDILNRLWFPILILLCILILTIKFASGQTPEIKDSKRLVEIDQNTKALNVLHNAIQSNPTVASLWYYQGIAQLKEGQRDLAAKSFEKGLTIDDKEPLNYIGRGYLSLLEDNPTKSKLDFDKALSLTKSKNTVVLQSISEAYLGIKQADKALELLVKAKSIDDHDPETFTLLGDTYLAQNNGGLAVTSYERAASLDTKLAKPYYKIGLVYLRSRNLVGAQEAFNNAIELDENYTLAHKELGELYYLKKEGDKAVKAYQKYLSLTDKPELGKLRYAFFLFMAKQFPQANDIFEELIQQKDVNPITLRYYAFSLYEAGDYEQAGNVFEQYFSKVSEQEIEATDYAYYGKLLLKQSKDSLATLQLQKSLVLESNQPELLQLQAETFYKSKKYSESISNYRQLHKLRSKLVSQDLYTLGRAYYFNRQYQEADSTFLKLIELQPNMTVGYLWEARTKSNLDPESENGLAKPYYESLIQKASASPEKNKSELAEAYSYLGYYHFLKKENTLSKGYWTKVLGLNPNDVKAKEALKAIH